MERREICRYMYKYCVGTGLSNPLLLSTLPDLMFILPALLAFALPQEALLCSLLFALCSLLFLFLSPFLSHSSSRCPCPPLSGAFYAISIIFRNFLLVGSLICPSPRACPGNSLSSSGPCSTYWLHPTSVSLSPADITFSFY